MGRSISISRRWRAVAALSAAAAIMAGCVSARIDYSLSDVRHEAAAPGMPQTATLKIIDLRHSDKKSVSAYAYKAGAYNEGFEIPRNLADYGEVMGRGGDRPGVRWYTAPDRLYWVSSGPIESLGEMLGRHLERAGRFRAVKVEPPSAVASAASAAGDGARLVVTIRRFLALKERRPVADTIGFLGLSALSSSAEITAIDADWVLFDATGRELRKGALSRVITDGGNSFRAKNRPFGMLNGAARILGGEVARTLR